MKSIIESKDFYPFLCEYSSNDIENVVDNLAKIINYLLSEDTITNDLENLFDNAVNYHKEGKYILSFINTFNNIFHNNTNLIIPYKNGFSSVLYILILRLITFFFYRICISSNRNIKCCFLTLW